MARRLTSKIIVTTGLVAGSVLAAPSPHAAPVGANGYHPTVQASAVSALVEEFGISAPTALSRLEAAPRLAALGERLRAQLGPDSEFWIDHRSGELVVNVRDGKSAAAVRAAGARPQLVSRGAVALAAIVGELNAVGGPPGTSWGVDPRTDRVLVSVSAGTPRGAQLGALLAAVGRHGDAVAVEHVPGMIGYALQGGEAISKSNGARCSAGFVVVPGWPGPYPPSGGNRILTAGHCTAGYPNWYVGTATGPYIGPTLAYSFPGNDYGLIRLDNTAVPLPRTINLYNGSSQVISNSGDPYVGRPVCKSGFKTGLTCGTVNLLNTSVSDYRGTVTGLARSNACVLVGDSGGGFFQNTTAVGITSASNQTCTNARSYMQPVREATHAYNLFFPAS